MHAESMESWTHDHVFLRADHARNERRTRMVVALCCAMMVAEIVGGILFRSMALLADGLHMSTHATALLIAAIAYAFARRRANDRRFTFGTGKLGDLAGFTSAIVLAMIALLIACESVARLFHPVPIAFNERATGAVLLRMRPNTQLVRSVRECLEQGSDRVADLHLWRVGPGHNAVVATIVSHEPQAPSFYKGRLANLAGLSHLTIEVERCA